ncbi:Glycosyltransferase, GT2 family [Thermoanaerobacter thermohydrosulfuricus]|jgi:GT2 family glycosyltransferase|nr:Glycosyltransferase, GT2 family [Thermoanaerobacter thermohydrosulfuricus]
MAIDNQKVAAVVVTFNRKNLLIECLDALLSQTYKLTSIIIIDNASTDGTYDTLKEKGYLDKGIIDYVRLNENIGGAGGFYEGIKRGYEKGYDWLWIMDDDAEPKNDALEKLVIYGDKLSVKALVSGIYNKRDLSLQKRVYESVIKNDKLYKNYNHEKNDFITNDYIKICSYPLLGLFIHKDVIKNCGNVRKEFFIQCDDLEYTLRISDLYEIVWVRDSVLFHKESEDFFITRKFLGRDFSFLNVKQQWKDYYGFRNHIIVSKMRFGKEFRISKYIKDYIKRVIKIILIEDFKLYRLHIYTKALFDGINNKSGKRIIPGYVPFMRSGVLK